MPSVYTAKLALARGCVGCAWVLMAGALKSVNLGGVAIVAVTP
jgi:hypothetical protein